MPVRRMNGFDLVALTLVIVGAINWGIIGLAGSNLIALTLGEGFLARSFYVVIGLAGIYAVWTASKAAQEARGRRRLERPRPRLSRRA